jgi:hypothetical protein
MLRSIETQEIAALHGGAVFTEFFESMALG